MRTRKRIEQRTRSGREWVFTPFDFLDLGTPYAVGMALTRLLRKGTIRRIARGLYDRPRPHRILGTLHPSADAIANALARKLGTTIQPGPAVAANQLGLSEQVPARITYETDGASRTFRLTHPPIVINFKHRSPRRLPRVGTGGHRKLSETGALVTAALRSLGKDHVSATRLVPLQAAFSARQRSAIKRDIPLAPAWMRPHLMTLVSDS